MRNKLRACLGTSTNQLVSVRVSARLGETLVSICMSSTVRGVCRHQHAMQLQQLAHMCYEHGGVNE